MNQNPNYESIKFSAYCVNNMKSSKSVELGMESLITLSKMFLRKSNQAKQSEILSKNVRTSNKFKNLHTIQSYPSLWKPREPKGPKASPKHFSLKNFFKNIKKYSIFFRIDQCGFETRVFKTIDFEINRTNNRFWIKLFNNRDNRQT